MASCHPHVIDFSSPRKQKAPPKGQERTSGQPVGLVPVSRRCERSSERVSSSLVEKSFSRAIALVEARGPFRSGSHVGTFSRRLLSQDEHQYRAVRSRPFRRVVLFCQHGLRERVMSCDIVGRFESEHVLATAVTLIDCECEPANRLGCIT